MPNRPRGDARASVFLAALAGALAAGALACSGASSGGGSGGRESGSSGAGGASGTVDSGATASSGAASCLFGSVSSTCWSCLEEQCGFDLGAFEGSCAGYLDCICPGGTYDASSTQEGYCSAQITGRCSSSALSLSNCQTETCASSCDLTSDGGGNGSGVNGGSGSGADDAGIVECSTAPCGSSGATAQICATASGSCYVEVGDQVFQCASCSDTTSCFQSADAACP